MNYLLDTHSFIWAVMSPAKLSRKVTKIIKNGENNIFVSAITFWEISLKYSINKLELENITPEKLPGIATKSGFLLLNLPSEMVSSFYKLPKKLHKDPFDRMLIWQTINENMVLISKDSELAEYRENGLEYIW